MENDATSAGFGGCVRPQGMLDMMIERMTTMELLALNRQTLHELHRREVIRTLNAPTGDWAELLVATAYDGTLAPNSEKSFDSAHSTRKRHSLSRTSSKRC